MNPAEALDRMSDFYASCGWSVEASSPPTPGEAAAERSDLTDPGYLAVSLLVSRFAWVHHDLMRRVNGGEKLFDEGGQHQQFGMDMTIRAEGMLVALHHALAQVADKYELNVHLILTMVGGDPEEGLYTPTTPGVVVTMKSTEMAFFSAMLDACMVHFRSA